MKRFIFIALAILLPISAFAVLAGKDRVDREQWFQGTTKAVFGNGTAQLKIYHNGTNPVLESSAPILISGGITGPASVDASVVFEGATADAFETTLTVVDPTADRIVSIPNVTGTILLSTADQDAANSIKGVANGLEFEGATADAFETTITITDPTADRTITVPNATGTISLGGSTVVTTGANTACNTTCGTGKCLGGQDTGDTNKIIVACADAAADRCFCIP